MADILGTEVLSPSASGDTCFTNVRLPLLSVGDHEHVHVKRRSEVAQEIMRVLSDHHDTFVAVVWHGKAWWARLSAQVYLDLSDFKWIAGVLGRVCGRVREGGLVEVVGKRDGVDVGVDDVGGMVESVAIN